MNPVQNYLRLSSGYSQFLGGLRWSSREDAIETKDGATFALTEEIAEFLEGLGRERRLIHFGFVLHLLDLVRGTTRRQTAAAARLSRAFHKGGSSLRQAGAFCAALCRELPRIPEDLEAADVCERLRDPTRPIRWYIVSFHDTFYPAEQAPLPPEAFEELFLRNTTGYSDEELVEWFRHGRGPVKEAAAALVRQIEVPRTLATTLAALLERPRLAGARAFVAQLVSALTLPPRRLERQDLPMGGFADVSTHGQIDHLLPSQFALDELDFYRRLAEKELLYFRREEPHAPSRQELVVLLDQGVRTWGDVRLVLSAAVLALGQQAVRRRTSFLLTTTAVEGELCDPSALDVDHLGQIVEASDLTPHPGLTLERVLEDPAKMTRDIVLLTHPRNLREEDVVAAARRLGRNDRLFAVTLDGGGQGEFAELKRGIPVALRQFRVDFRQRAEEPAPLSSVPGAKTAWRGDVEPIPFPFRFGIPGVEPPSAFEFDWGGNWLLTASAHGGLLHAWKTDGREMEILPRAFIDGNVFTTPEVILGVTGGFVVAGRMSARWVTVHYDFVRRHCTAYVLESKSMKPWRWTYLPMRQTSMRAWAWAYAPAQHTLIALGNSHTTSGWCLDLATGQWYDPDKEAPASRPRDAWFAWHLGQIPWCGPVLVCQPGKLVGSEQESPVVDASASTDPDPRSMAGPLLPSLAIDHHSGAVDLYGPRHSHHSFTPRADGQPLFKGCIALEARWCGPTLCVKVNRLGPRGGIFLHLLQMPEGIPLEGALIDASHPFALSPDGAQLARLCHGREVSTVGVYKRAGTTAFRTVLAQPPTLKLGSGWLLVSTAERDFYTVRWKTGPLEMRRHSSEPAASSLYGPNWMSSGTAAGSELPEKVRYDSERWVAAAEFYLHAVVDRYGQIAILNPPQELVCMMFAFRGELAAWLPDGTRLGPPGLTGGPASADAEAKIGRALWEASFQARIRP